MAKPAKRKTRFSSPVLRQNKDLWPIARGLFFPEFTPVACRAVYAACIIFLVSGSLSNAQDHPDQLLWGDVHLHSNLSWDAYYMGNQSADPDTAYRFARGAPVVHPFHRARVRISQPLDFLAVTDHSEFLGLPYGALKGQDDRLTKARLAQYLQKVYEDGGSGATALVSMIVAFQTANATRAAGGAAADFPPPPPQVTEEFVDWISENPDIWDEFFNTDVMQSSWEHLVDVAEKHNDPGKFTTLIGWEYSPQAKGGNLHRVVLTPADGETARKIRPFSFMDSDNPEHLWDWLKKTREETGAEFVAIPHNSNLSKGTMFARTNRAGEPIDENYARKRARWETVAEVTQMKGDSETHPLLSPDDEFADFEFFAHELASFKDDIKVPPVTEADYVRSALKTGLEFENRLGVNPYKLGMIGSTDGHNAVSSTSEANFLGKFGEGTTPEQAGKPVGDFSGYTNWDFSSSGLAAVWAKDNTRDEIFAAFRRREVYGTTGPRIRLRFFGGYGFTGRDIRARDLAKTGYLKGVPMGGDLLPLPARSSLPFVRKETVPGFLVHAVKDPAGANLDRIQIVKGWVDADEGPKEKVFDVAWSGDRIPDEGNRLPGIGDTVDRALAKFTNDIGDAELVTVWKDRTFDPDQPAFYYVRVLEIPTPRQSLYDTVALQIAHPETFPEVIQERAYSSPIWYSPDRNQRVSPRSGQR